ncbi:MAG: hypothetical protein KIT27_03975 [Legionellales bacterium]|nr:hypothetical protein [Legionellales bacterium]
MRVKYDRLFLETHRILVEEIKTDLITCRSAIVKTSDYLIGNGDINNAYIMLRIQILPGRSDEVKNRTGKRLLEKIYRDFADEIKLCTTQVRVYLTETEKQHYYGLE